MLTHAGVPGLDQPPDDGAALVTGLLHSLALLLVEAMLQDHPDVGLILTGVLGGGQGFTILWPSEPKAPSPTPRILAGGWGHSSEGRGEEVLPSSWSAAKPPRNPDVWEPLMEQSQPTTHPWAAAEDCSTPSAPGAAAAGG